MPRDKKQLHKIDRMMGGRRPEIRSGSQPVQRGHAVRRRSTGGGLPCPSTIDLIIDYSRSMKEILPTVYIFCMDLMHACQTGGCRVRFGVTFFSDEAEIRTWRGEAFTEKPTDVLNAMLNQEVGGGSRTHRENIGQAVRRSLDKLQAVPAGERVIVLFTDTSPQDMELVNCRCGQPVRSAVLFVPVQYSGSEYLFRMVDGQGHPENSKSPVVFDIEEVIGDRYLKIQMEAGDDGERMLTDNCLLRDQLLLALS